MTVEHDIKYLWSVYFARLFIRNLNGIEPKKGTTTINASIN